MLQAKQVGVELECEACHLRFIFHREAQEKMENGLTLPGVNLYRH
ncbi:hypothetical protein [Planctomicrobium piriforme]|nr:hypothetical protein [Planctomicrobium piriforme]